MADQLMEASVQGTASVAGTTMADMRASRNGEGLVVGDLSTEQGLPLMGASVQGDATAEGTLISYSPPTSGRLQNVKLDQRTTWEAP